MTIEEYITQVYCVVDDEMKAELKAQPLPRRAGPKPRLSCSEVITMELVGEYLGYDTDKGIWEYFRRHYLSFFPSLASRSSFVRQAANLWAYKQRLQRRLAWAQATSSDQIHIVDGIPMTVCNFKRAPRRKIFLEEADLGRCETKAHVYCGFKGHLMVDTRGVITQFSLTPASMDERKAAWDVIDDIQGVLLADKGYTGADNKQLLKQETGITLLCGHRKNEAKQLPKPLEYSISRVRKIIETVIGQLSERFHLERVRARDRWHLTSRVWRKLLAHTLNTYLTYLHKLPTLKFENLVTS